MNRGRKYSRLQNQPTSQKYRTEWRDLGTDNSSGLEAPNRGFVYKITGLGQTTLQNILQARKNCRKIFVAGCPECAKSCLSREVLKGEQASFQTKPWY